MPFSLVLSQGDCIHHSIFFCSVTSVSDNRPRKEGRHGGGVHSFFSLELDKAVDAFASKPAKSKPLLMVTSWLFQGSSSSSRAYPLRTNR